MPWRCVCARRRWMRRRDRTHTHTHGTVPATFRGLRSVCRRRRRSRDAVKGTGLTGRQAGNPGGARIILHKAAAAAISRRTVKPRPPGPNHIAAPPVHSPPPPKKNNKKNSEFYTFRRRIITQTRTRARQPSGYRRRVLHTSVLTCTLYIV